MQNNATCLKPYKDPNSAEATKLGRVYGFSSHEITLACAMFSHMIDCPEAKWRGAVTRYVLYCWISDCAFNYSDADIQRIVSSAKLGESGTIGFHEFVSSCGALFAGRMCASKADAFSEAVAQCHLFHGDPRGGPPSMVSRT